MDRSDHSDHFDVRRGAGVIGTLIDPT